MTRFIKRAWRGEERLWKVFWLGGVLASMALQAVFFSLFLALLARPTVALFILGGLAGFAVTLAYTVWSAVAIWRCAFNCHGSFWGYAARFGLVLALLGLGYSIAIFPYENENMTADDVSGWKQAGPATIKVSPVEYKSSAATSHP